MKRIRSVVPFLLWMAGAVTLFIFMEWKNGFFGFPLDDAWIHQTYARSLAEGEGWVFAGGAPSAGSTSPAWTYLMSAGFLLGIPPVTWSYLCGVSLLGLNAAGVWIAVRSQYPKAAYWAALLTAGEWHLVWASLSGMEVLLFSGWAVVLWAVCLVAAWDPWQGRWGIGTAVVIGLWAGAGIWIRPEAIIATGIAGLGLGWIAARRGRWFPLAVFALVSAGVVAAYFGWMYSIEGRIWPNTFYAKPIEYRDWLMAGIGSRLYQLLLSMLAGPLAILMPLSVIGFSVALITRKWSVLPAAAWSVLHIAAYALRLPAAYQHGRYLIPTFPIWIGLGAAGLAFLFIPWKRSKWGWAAGRLLAGSVGVLAPLYLWIGSGQFAIDVGVIETEMVRGAVWIRDHTAPDAVIAAHDIGALGFWSGRTVVDLGGLIDPDAWPILEEPDRLADFLLKEQADYLFTFPSLYPEVTGHCRAVFVTGGSYSIALKGENMAVYPWPDGCQLAAGGATR